MQFSDVRKSIGSVKICCNNRKSFYFKNGSSASFVTRVGDKKLQIIDRQLQISDRIYRCAKFQFCPKIPEGG